MSVTNEHVRALSALAGFEVPDEDLPAVVARLSALLDAMAVIEVEMGADMDRVEPIPPVYPHEPF
jgi:hypothetical protein